MTTYNMGRPSKGRTERIQAMVTPAIKDYLEQQRRQQDETVSDVVFHLIEAAQMGTKEIVYTTQLPFKNRRELVSHEIVQEFLDCCPSNLREHYQQRPYEDQQLLAGRYLAHRYALKEAERMGYEETMAYLLDRENWVIIGSAYGDTEGSQVAEEYGFNADEVIRRSKDAKWSAIEWGRDGDAFVFIRAGVGVVGSRFPESLYHVGVAWAPETLMEKYEAMPVLVPGVLI